MSDPSLHADVPPSLVEARDVRVSLQGTEILHGVSLRASAGEVVALMGGNGSGKSTFVRGIVGAVPIASGAIDLFGSPAAPLTRARLGYVPQRITAAGGVSATAIEVVTSGLLGARETAGRTGSRLRGLVPPHDARARARAALASMGVEDLAKRDVSRLSGGQQQRVLIARALVREPRLLILDEPMAGVDLQSQVAFAHTLGHLKEDGVGILVVLHELGALARHIDRAVVLEQGCVTYDGVPPKDLGVHALPGHDHEHPHTDPPVREGGSLGLEGP
ncbi:ATP-binding cassette domain-containing protein [Demequina sp. SYSU T00039]|uniref:ATP-binding cassette domain-containing protein n=1 Tax=Demequina lignilytica TaxID=3051663 RepID=A0AAW7M6W3_9MICO|nr:MULTISPECIES: ATP-binding cassette domain-containing protein [unclassified Demequina]MDN4478485.1 ATP-binding cassette domain-containing protein [Demequina sp. SYSU T00039-1]MDN4487008.1 ATP-binding cassette domain-containing protein [Demequina sp. SYSU T00039]MDN4489719.1 ATP-binding cassette domain-containing protein [Demequina sp. SYSU T00068]